MSNDPPFILKLPEQPDYLQFVDDDIKAMFVGKGGYFSQEVLMAQLIKEFRLLRAALPAIPDGEGSR